MIDMHADLLPSDVDVIEVGVRGSTNPYSAKAAERVRDALFTTFGYYQTESSHHASEYAPYFRKSAELVDAYIPHRWDYYHICRAHDGICRAHDGDAQAADLLRRLKADLTPSIEYGARILRAMETGEPVTVYGNVANRGLIPNLPDGCCVEVPCLVDRNGVQPTAPGPLPPQCAALNRTNVNVQELAVAAAVTGDPEHVHHALALDPLTGALLTLPRIRELTDELLAAESAWLPSFGPARVDDV